MADGRVLLITGASTGIGEATARMAAEKGFRLVLNARNPDKLAVLANELGADTAIAAPGDVAKPDDCTAMVAAATDTFGQLDAVLANAGRGGSRNGFADGEPDEWHAMLMTNVYGLALTVRASLPALKASNGHLLITGSNAGRRPLPGSFYGMTKWAATAIGYNVRSELSGTGVRVTLIEPGIVDTPFFDDPKPDGLQADDVARSILFALEQPDSVMIHEMVVVPSKQKW